MINWEAIFVKYKEVSVFYKLKQGSNDVAAFDKAVAEFYTKIYGLQDVKQQLRYFFSRCKWYNIFKWDLSSYRMRE